MRRCVEIKSDIVSRDEFDTGERQKLNLGHTLGHAIERCSDFAVSHGHAVAIGTVRACIAAQKLGVCKDNISERVKKLWHETGSPSRPIFPFMSSWESCTATKMQLGGNKSHSAD